MKWTFEVVSDGARRFRQSHLRRSAVSLTIGVLLFLLAAGGSFAGRTLAPGAHDAEMVRLQAHNDALRAELDSLNARLGSLDGAMAELEERDELFRLLAGLEPGAGPIQKVGLPARDTVERSALWRYDRSAAHEVHDASNRVASLLYRAARLALSWSEAEDTLETKHARMAATPSIVPTAGYITSSFSSSRWHPILDRPRPHEGVDIVAPTGTPIIAAASGRVRVAGLAGDYGLMVELEHGYGMRTRYAHASRVLVRPGEFVERGDTIARVGQTGLAVGPHLHYEVLLNGRPADPRGFIMDARVVTD